MPVLQTIALKSPPTNVFGLYQYVAQRVPGYDISEYLRELNAGYVHVWEEIAKLKNHYFTTIKTVTIANPQFNYDLLFNADSGLSSAISPRLYQITKLRFQSPNGGLFMTAQMNSPNEPEFVGLNANMSATPAVTGPYNCWLGGRGQLNVGLPLAIGTVMEVTYTSWPIALVILSGGTVSTSGNTVTGSGTSFTSLCQPDFQSYLPNVGGQEEIQAELVCNGGVALGGQVYRVKTISSDTAMTTTTSVSPALAGGSLYVLATLPEIPREHLRVIAAIAIQKMFSVAQDDARVTEWTAIAQSNLQMMKDSLIERQSVNPPRKIRFPGSIANARNRTFLR